ncbi:MAG: hypothetical protein IPM54_06365 [Polyangiaceae bacterium]|nr:hypothetical protein [Polyangiaceae bacterium]
MPVRDAKKNRSNIFQNRLPRATAQRCDHRAAFKLRLRSQIRYTRDDIVESSPVTFDLPPQAMTLQSVKLDNGELVHASGNLLVYPKEGKVVYQDMAKQS